MKLNAFKKSIQSSIFVKNSFWLMGEKIISLAFSLVINILIARQLGAESFGILSYLLAIFGIITPLSSIGFNALITKELVNNPKQTQKIMSTALMFRVLGAILAFLLCLLIINNVTLDGIHNKKWAFILFAAINILNSLHVIDFWFQSKLKNNVVVICRFINTLVFFVIKLICFILNASLDVYILVHAIEFAFLVFLFLIAYSRYQQMFSLTSIDWGYGAKLLRQALWLILSGIASVIYLKIDQLMLGEMVSSAEVGQYAVASRLSEVWYFFATAIVTAYFPRLLALKEECYNGYVVHLQKICDALFTLALIIAVIVSFIGPLVIQILYGNEYLGAGSILVIHIWASIFVFMRALLSKWLIAEQLVKYSLVTHGIGCLVNVALNIYLIPLYSGVGAALSTVISYAFASYIALFFSKATWPMATTMSISLISPFRFVWLSLKLARN